MENKKANRLLSRKFDSMLAGVLINLVVGLVKEVDPTIVVGLAAGLIGLWILVEGRIDTKALGGK